MKIAAGSEDETLERIHANIKRGGKKRTLVKALGIPEPGGQLHATQARLHPWLSTQQPSMVQTVLQSSV